MIGFVAAFERRFFFVSCALTPAFVTLLAPPWNASVDCCDLAVGPEARRFGGIVSYRYTFDYDVGMRLQYTELVGVAQYGAFKGASVGVTQGWLGASLIGQSRLAR